MRRWKSNENNNIFPIFRLKYIYSEAAANTLIVFRIEFTPMYLI